ncbi:LCP family protein [Romboutsia sp. 1001713B170131_170501_G6]|uniref:LCP family protein n=1 Tax=Romboutsia sp. 1001713B170131_170501_G6 TaxID=2787108 RepID=UPI0018AA8AEF|nr:LCP family protein [Romboutsia sp. 1001713B170131_170501_G6]
MSKLKKIILGLVIAIIAIPLVGFGALYFKLNSMYDKEEAKKVNDKIEKVDETNGITNILLAGIDGNNMDKGNRSDAMMILTIDSKNNDIRLTSLARDTYADIPGYGKEKLTHAYAYGGPSLLLETIDKNFDVPIDKYVVVSFESFTKIIDVLGGIQIDVLDREVSHIPGVKSSGLQTLDGAQALAYSRIRYADDAFHRDNRQRTVIEALYNKLLSDFSSNFMEVANDIIGYTKTNLTPMEIMSIATKVIKINDDKFEQMEFPLEGHRNGYVMNKEKGYIIEWDEAYNKDQLHKFIFDYKNFNK